MKVGDLVKEKSFDRNDPMRWYNGCSTGMVIRFYSQTPVQVCEVYWLSGELQGEILSFISENLIKIA
jgi:hypothetical protein